MKERAVRRKPAKETLRANIKDYIQKQIAAGVYRPGDRIVETQLAREMNVSQAPVREAILEMVALGLLEERPYSGHFVRALGPEEIEDIYRTRAVVEEYAAQRAADRATKEQLAEMKRLLQEMDANRDLDRFVHQDMEFHALVMDAAGSAALKRAWTMLRMAEWTYIAAAVTKTSLAEMIQQRFNISVSRSTITRVRNELGFHYRFTIDVKLCSTWAVRARVRTFALGVRFPLDRCRRL